LRTLGNAENTSGKLYLFTELIP